MFHFVKPKYFSHCKVIDDLTDMTSPLMLVLFKCLDIWLYYLQIFLPFFGGLYEIIDFYCCLQTPRCSHAKILDP